MYYNIKLKIRLININMYRYVEKKEINIATHILIKLWLEYIELLILHLKSPKTQVLY